MKNILTTVFTLLIIILIVLAMVRGISVGKVQILSISQIIQKNNELTKMIDDANNLNNVTYKNTLNSLQTETKQLSTAKSSYLSIASVSTEEEIKEANQESSYAKEFLWSKIGNHATSEGVNLKIVATSTGVSNKNNLAFTVTGSYIGIRDFVYSLENDSDLNFKIENFKIQSGSTEESLVSEFLVKDIGIKQETTTENPTTTKKSTTQTNTNDTNENQNTVKKDNASQRIDEAVGY